MEMVDFNFGSVVDRPDADWPPILYVGLPNGKKTYMELQEQFDKHGKDLTLQLWAPIQVQTHRWAMIAVAAAAWTAPLRDGEISPSGDPNREEVVFVAVFARGGTPQAFCAPVRRIKDRLPQLGKWNSMPSPLEGPAMTAMQSAVDGVLDVSRPG
jgi:hypothetical protein